MEKLSEKFRTQCYMHPASPREMRMGCEVGFDILLHELAKLVRRHGPGECVDFAHITALMDQILAGESSGH